MNFKEIDGNGTVEGFALVKTCDKKTAKNGSVFLDLHLADKSGEINAKMWDFRDGVNFLPEVNTIIKARGTLQQYNGNDQFKDDHQDVAEDRKQRKNNAIGFSDFFIFGILMILDQGLAQPFKHYPYYSSKNV